MLAYLEPKAQAAIPSQQNEIHFLTYLQGHLVLHKVPMRKMGLKVLPH